MGGVGELGGAWLLQHHGQRQRREYCIPASSVSSGFFWLLLFFAHYPVFAEPKRTISRGGEKEKKLALRKNIIMFELPTNTVNNTW